MLCGFSQARILWTSAAPAGCERRIGTPHSLPSCSVTGALGESGARVVSVFPCRHELSDCCIVTTEGRQFLESELETDPTTESPQVD